MLYQYVRKRVNNLCRITDSFRQEQFMGKYLNALSTAEFIINLLAIPNNLIIEFLIFQINEALSKVIRVQLYLIAHQIYNPLDNGFEVRGIFLDIPKVIHKA